MLLLRLLPRCAPLGLLAGCGLFEKVCEDPTPAPVAACLGADTLALTGTLTGITTDGLPAACAVFFGTGVTTAAATGLEITTDDGAIWVGVSLPDLALPLQEGDAVQVEGRFVTHASGPATASLALRAATDDGAWEDALWLGQAAALADLAPPDSLSLEAGGEVCTGELACGTWASRRLKVATPEGGGESATLDVGEQAVVGSWVVTHGLFDEPTSQTGLCEELPGTIVVGAVRVP